MEKNEKIVNNISWSLSGAALALGVLSICTLNLVMGVIAFSLLILALIVYNGYSFIVGPDREEVMSEVHKTGSQLQYINEQILYSDGDVSIGSSNTPISYVLTNSQITAECIKAGITDPEDIQWVQIVNESPLVVQSRIQILKAKYQSK